MTVCAAFVYSVRDRFAYLYTSDAEVVALVADVALVYVLFVMLSGTTQCLRGILTGCGRQPVLAKVSIFASYAVGVPLSFILSGVTPYGLDWGLSGIWLGLASSNVVRSLILFNVLRVQDWDAIALKAMEKAREKAPSPGTPRK